MSAPLPQYPRIPAWRRPYVRRTDEVQFGVAPGAPVVGGVTTVEASLLAGLDGLLTQDQAGRVAAEAGVAPRRWRELLELVAALGLLVDDGATVPGPGTTARPAVTAVRAAASGVAQDGVGPRVLLDGTGADQHGGDLVEHVAEALREMGRGVVLSDPVEVDLVLATPSPAPELVVLVGAPVLDPHRGDVWLHRGVPHLPVVGAGHRGTVGPLVDPRVPTSPCLWCLDHHRSDRDTAWPAVLTQALSSERAGYDPRRPTVAGGAGRVAATPVLLTRDGAATEPLAPGLTQLVAGATTLLAERVLRGEPTPPGVSVEVSLPWPRMDHRRWSPHPRCERGHGRSAEVVGAPPPRLI